MISLYQACLISIPTNMIEKHEMSVKLFDFLNGWMICWLIGWLEFAHNKQRINFSFIFRSIFFTRKDRCC